MHQRPVVTVGLASAGAPLSAEIDNSSTFLIFFFFFQICFAGAELISQRAFDEHAVIFGPLGSIAEQSRAELRLSALPGCGSARQSEGSNALKLKLH